MLSQPGLRSGADFGTQPPCAPQCHHQNLAEHFPSTSCSCTDPLPFFPARSTQGCPPHPSIHLGAFSQGLQPCPSCSQVFGQSSFCNWKSNGCSTPGKRKDKLPAPLHRVQGHFQPRVISHLETSTFHTRGPRPGLHFCLSASVKDFSASVRGLQFGRASVSSLLGNVLVCFHVPQGSGWL